MKKLFKKLFVLAFVLSFFVAPLAFAQGLPSGGGDGLPSTSLWKKDGASAINTTPAGLDIGTVSNPVGDIYAGTLNISGITLSGALTVSADSVRAFLVEKTDGTDVLTINTITPTITMDGTALLNRGGVLAHGWSFGLGGSTSLDSLLYADAGGFNQLMFGLAANTGNQFLFTSRANFGKDHDHAAETDPAVYFTSATNPDTDPEQYGKLQHDQTNFVISAGSGAIIKDTVTASITASTTQAQGNGVLTSNVNEISTVANLDDTVTLPAAPPAGSLKVTIINNGANTVQIFPASGDNLGAGVNISVQLEANESVDYVAYDTTNWHIEASTELIHATMYDEDNTDAFVVTDSGADFQSYHSNGLGPKDLAGWVFDAGGAGVSFPIASIADAGGGDITVTTTGTHGLDVGAIVSQSNLADTAYVGVFEVLTVPSTTTYTVTAAFTSTGTGTMDEAATLTANIGSGGVHTITYGGSSTSATNNETFDFRIYQNATRVTGMNGRRKFGTGGDFGWGGPGTTTVNILDGDKISWALSNEDSAGNITNRNFTLFMLRI